MDSQTFFNVAVGLAAAFGGYILKSISRAIERLDRDVRQMPYVYVTQTHFKNDLDEIKITLRRIEDKLDNKVDK